MPAIPVGVAQATSEGAVRWVQRWLQQGRKRSNTKGELHVDGQVGCCRHDYVGGVSVRLPRKAAGGAGHSPDAHFPPLGVTRKQGLADHLRVPKEKSRTWNSHWRASSEPTTVRTSVLGLYSQPSLPKSTPQRRRVAGCLYLSGQPQGQPRVGSNTAAVQQVATTAAASP